MTTSGLRDTARQVLLPLWNAWYFLTLYANAAGVHGEVRDGVERPFSTHVLDRYVLAKTRDLVEDVTRTMDAYDLFGACAAVRSFVETLTNWYIRRSRQRFWDGDKDAIDTLHTVLDMVVRVAAPLLPFVTEEIYSGLHGDAATQPASPHLTDWPRTEDLPGDEALVRTMDEVRDVCSATLSVRKQKGLRVRQPLAGLTIASPDVEQLRPFFDIIMDEVNVKEIVPLTDPSSLARQSVQVVPSVVGPRLGADTQHVLRAVREGEWVVDGDQLVAAWTPTRSGRVRVDGADRGRPRRRDADHRNDRADRRRDHARSGDRRPGPRPRADDPAGPARPGPRRHRPHQPAHQGR